jgi:hypothetical protein
MSIPIEIGFRLANGRHECCSQLSDDGIYWFLHPWFQRVRNTTGKYVDLYGDAEFHEANGLCALMDAMAEARMAAQAQPPQWQVHTGRQLRPVHKDLYQMVSRVDVVRAIDRVQSLLEEARAMGKTICFHGD